MRSVTAYLMAAALLALVGALSLTIGLLDRDVARAQERIIAAEYVEPAPIFERAARYYEYASLVPWIGNGPLNDIRARQAALQYWQRRYTALTHERANPLDGVPSDNVALQFLVANATYRDGLATAKDKATTLAALDTAASTYQTVLRNADHHHDAAYNFEYVTRLRNDIDRGRRKAPAPVPSVGREGLPGTQPEEAVDGAKFKVYIPLEQEQIDKTKPGDAGKQAPIRKKG